MKPPTSSMQKELDSETGLYYYGARYYNPRISVWYGVDSLAEKFPNESPYIYCSNNPVVFIDPDGRFKIPIHLRITENALKNSGLGRGFMNAFSIDLKQGVSYRADIIGAASDYHFDGRKNYNEVQTIWKELNSKINNKIKDIGNGNKTFGGEDVIKFGVMLHNVQDFYSHSIYVELYIDYYKKENNGAMPSSVPIYDSEKGGTNDSNFNEILKTSLRTGDFDVIDNEITNPNGNKAQQPTNHNKMNKDKANTPAGKLAEKVATEHSKKILKQLK